MHRTLDTFTDLSVLHERAPRRYPHLLESVAHGTAHARYDVLFAFPGDALVLHGRDRLLFNDRPTGPDFLGALDRLWRTEATVDRPGPPLPFTGGWFVFLAYEFGHVLEPVAGDMVVDTRLPTAMAVRFPAAIIRDHVRRQTHLLCEPEANPRLLSSMVADVSACAIETSVPAACLPVAAVTEEDPALYLGRIARVLAYIRAGDVFQVNLSRGWQAQLTQPVAAVEIYRRLRAANRAPFAGLMTFNDGRAVISSSPERLVSVRDGVVGTRPIAGTYPRSSDPSQDALWSRELVLHPKERAEHIMLVDLERNDLGRVCQSGSVQVNEIMTVESYAHVHHIVSNVQGRLRTAVSPGDVIRAVFPGGTITGCPKIRTMQIIAELERGTRGAYTGSMGYLNRDGSMDLNILIRTLVQDGLHLGFRAGGGIVADSDPDRELNETRAKALGLLNALGHEARAAW